ncbi:tyrosine-type recombinase/integrase [Pseudomonas plecoglossicida]|uniref:tyrosine-type recombinase/integrase n=1 Tax=Pseudomonas plecoglossicida TaxID=70775 RepID=UPI003D1B635C
MGRDGGGVRPASSSSIEITFQYQGVRCRERVQLKPTAANLKKAEQHKAAIEHAISNGTFDYATTFPASKRAAKFARVSSNQNIGVYLDEWLERKTPKLKTSTVILYRSIIRSVLKPFFGNLALCDLNKKVLKEKFSEYKASNTRITSVQTCFRSALNDAIEDEIIDSHPLSGWSYRNREEVKEDDDIDPFTREEQQALLKASRGETWAQLQFAFWTGLRPSELIALEWGDIDWIAGEIRVVRAKTRGAIVPESTKTPSSRRTIKMLGPAREALLKQKELTFLAGRHIFLDPVTGEPWKHAGYIYKTVWMPAMKKSGVRWRRPYQSRHTYASMMLSAGENPMWVAKQMGHKDWTMIAKVYGRWMPSADVGAGGRAEALFAGNASLMTTSSLDPAI